MWIASTHSWATGLIKLEKQAWDSLWILHGPQSPRPHRDGTPVRPHKVSHKVSMLFTLWLPLISSNVLVVVPCRY